MSTIAELAAERCETFVPGAMTCMSPGSGKSPDAPYLADRYCWPCRIRSAIAADESKLAAVRKYAAERAFHARGHLNTVNSGRIASDLLAILDAPPAPRLAVPRKSRPWVCRECQEGKHAACDGTAWDLDADDATECACEKTAHTLPPEPGIYLDPLGNVWRRWSDALFVMLAHPEADPRQYAPFARMDVRS